MCVCVCVHWSAEMVVMVNPAKMEVEEESTVSFHCLVLTDLPANTTVTWINTPQQQKEVDNIYNKEYSTIYTEQCLCPSLVGID